jgi:hypothetical protein
VLVTFIPRGLEPYQAIIQPDVRRGLLSLDQYIESVPYCKAVCVRCFPCRTPVVAKSNPPNPLSSTVTTTSTHLEKIAIVWLSPKLALHLRIVQFVNLSVGNIDQLFPRPFCACSSKGPWTFTSAIRYSGMASGTKTIQSTST